MLGTGQRAGDPHLTSWGQNGLGLLALTVGPLDEAAAHLSAVCDLTGRISSFRMQAGAGGLLAICRLRQGRVAQAGAGRPAPPPPARAPEPPRGGAGRPPPTLCQLCPGRAAPPTR